MPGELIQYECEDVGKVEKISCPASEKLLLKKNARVMLVWNLTDELKNGTPGTFLMVRNGLLEVDFGAKGKILLKRQTWEKRNLEGAVVGSRTQFPIVLFYASTCHKVQGLTLPAAVVHCTKEFVPGLIYVAVSRVRNEKQLQLCNFSPKQLLPPPRDAISVCDKNIAMIENHSCCTQQQLGLEFFQVSDRREELCEEHVDEPENLSSLSMDKYPDGIVCSFFEQEEETVVADLQDNVLLSLEDNENEMAVLPEELQIDELLEKKIVTDPLTDFAAKKNCAIRGILSNNSQIYLFARIQWIKIFNMFVNHLAKNPDELYTRKELTDATHFFYIELLNSADFRRELRSVFLVDELQEEHYSIGSTLCMDLFTMFVHLLAAKVVESHQLEQITIIRVDDMPPEGLAKIRHVGGWAFRKELEKRRKYVRSNMFSPSSSTQETMTASYQMCLLLEEHVVVQHSWLQENTAYPGTLDVTENRQYREHGLLHICDAAFDFVRELEQKRVDLINISRMQRDADKEGFIDTAILAIENDLEIESRWREIFLGIAGKKKVGYELYDQKGNLNQGRKEISDGNFKRCELQKATLFYLQYLVLI